MKLTSRIFAACLCLCATATILTAQSESAINNSLGKLRSLTPQQRGEETVKIAAQIDALKPGPNKVGLAEHLTGLVTEGDQGKNAVQAAVNSLSKALTESPVLPKKDEIPYPYLHLASVVRYEGVTSTIDSPSYKSAAKQLADQEEKIAKVDFTLKDLKNKPVKLSDLRGKIVVVNFWATWCPPCRNELPALDAIADRFKDQVVVLSISKEDAFKVNSFLSGTKFHPTVLIDPGGKVADQFFITGIPKTFVFNAEGKLAAVAEDERSARQFLQMLDKAGFK